MINYVAVLLAAVVAMIVGSLWYSPLLFGQRWASEMMWGKKTPAPVKSEMISAMVGMFLGAIVMSYVLAYMFLAVGVATLVGALTVAAWLWLGFVVVPAASMVLFEKRSLSLFMITIGNFLVTILAETLVLMYFVS
ncbi:DUF1761 domain-containing protein [Candidatus Gracilibacteria bacterium]|nr:DUF1761 domain-containing protein [Candidatus Gracilibacteria bacterium]